MIYSLISLLWLSIGCQKPSNKVVGEPSIPQLPAPQSAWYSVRSGSPKDQLVLKVSQDLPWDEALSGAAVEVAMNIVERPIRIEDVKWAAIRSGYPYSVDQIVVGDVDMDVFPKELRKLLQANNPETLGLVRVRKGTYDKWVAIYGRSGSFEENFPREINLNERLEIKGAGSWRILNPEGVISEGALPFNKEMNIPGEWWFEGVVSNQSYSFPIYVESGTPVHPLFISEDVGYDIESPDVLEEDAWVLLEDMRRRQGLNSTFEEDALLVSVSQQSVQRLVSNEWKHSEGLDLLEKVGFVGGPAYHLGCQAKTVFSCLDLLSWSIDSRKALLDPNIRSIGLSVYSQTSGVSMIINMSSL